MTGEADELARLREEIDAIDDEIATLVTDRVETAETVAQVKADAGEGLVDQNREAAVKRRYEERFEDAGLDGEDGRELAALLIDVALGQERQVADGA